MWVSIFPIVASALIFFWVVFSVAAQGQGVYSVTVSRVIDGDSLEVTRNGIHFQVRLWGIDAPEWGQDFSADAKALCGQLVGGKEIELHEKYTDTYGRTVAMVLIDGLPLNEELIRRGMAWVHIRYCDEKICNIWRELEAEARLSHSGLWKDGQPIPPWRWKNLKRGRKGLDDH
jgi:endonuclease YncB( thermonuclease family)